MARLTQLGPIEPDAVAFAMAVNELEPLTLAERAAVEALRRRLSEAAPIHR
jgi:hypothetical protein